MQGPGRGTSLCKSVGRPALLSRQLRPRWLLLSCAGQEDVCVSPSELPSSIRCAPQGAFGGQVFEEADPLHCTPGKAQGRFSVLQKR